MKLIDKDKIAAEIEKLISNGKLKCQQSQENNDQVSYIAWSEHIATCGKILSFLNTLKTKEVDLEKEFYDFLDLLIGKDNGHLSEDELFRIAEYFYDLGVQAKEGNTLVKTKGFLVRDKDDYTAIYSTKPERGKTEWVDGNHPRNANESSCLFTMDAYLLPNVEFDDEPVEVEVTITKKGE